MRIGEKNHQIRKGYPSNGNQWITKSVYLKQESMNHQIRKRETGIPKSLQKPQKYSEVGEYENRSNENRNRIKNIHLVNLNLIKTASQSSTASGFRSVDWQSGNHTCGYNLRCCC